MSPSPPPLPMAPFVLDSSFVLDYLEETGAAVGWWSSLSGALLPSVAAGEVFYKVFERTGVPPVAVSEVLRALGVEVVDVTAEMAELFPALREIDAARRAEQRSSGERAASLSMADLCVLGCASSRGLPVLTGDRHWSTLGRHGLTVVVHQFRDAQPS